MARARSFGNIRKLRSGKYQTRYWHVGKQIAADHAFVNKTNARRWLSTVEADMVRSDWVDADAGKIPFGECSGWWLEHRPVRPRTKQIYEGQLRHITPTFAAMSLCDIRPIDVRGWHGQLSRGPLHQNTIAKISRLFRTIMSTAVGDDLLRQNPVRIKGASAERMIERPLLTWVDVRALAGAIHPRFECLVWTAAASGLRFGEQAGLSVDDVNVDPSELRVSRALNAGVGPTLGPPKTERAVRTVAIPESVTLRLVVHLDLYGDAEQSDSLVFTSFRGGPLLNTHFAPQWPKARNEVALPPRSFPRPATPRRHRGGDGGRIAARGVGDDGPGVERCKPPLSLGFRKPGTRDRRCHRSTHG